MPQPVQLYTEENQWKATCQVMGEFRLLLFGCWQIKVANLNGNLATSDWRAYVFNTSQHFSHHSKQHVFQQEWRALCASEHPSPDSHLAFHEITNIAGSRYRAVWSGFPENSSLSASLPFNRTNRSDKDKQIAPTHFWTFSLELLSCCPVPRPVRLLPRPLHLLRSQRQKLETRAHRKPSLFCVVALQSRAEDYLYSDPGLLSLSAAPISCFTGWQHTDLLCHASSSLWFMLSHSAGSALISDEQ